MQSEQLAIIAWALVLLVLNATAQPCIPVGIGP